MIVNKSNFKDLISDYFVELPDKIEAHGKKALEPQDFDKVFNCKEADCVRNIIYVWQTKTEMPRIMGSSNLLYIGQTKRSLKDRHASYSKLKANSVANRQKFNHVVSNYGPISVSYFKITDDKFDKPRSLRGLEGQFLWWYFQNHSEYPPSNYTKTKNRNDELRISV